VFPFRVFHTEVSVALKCVPIMVVLSLTYIQKVTISTVISLRTLIISNYEQHN